MSSSLTNFTNSFTTSATSTSSANLLATSGQGMSTFIHTSEDDGLSNSLSIQGMCMCMYYVHV